MNRYLFLIRRFLAGIVVLCWLSSESLAQNKFLDYYRYINLAELAICDNDFAGACTHYRSAFNVNTGKPFSAHLLNAFYAAMDSKEYPFAESCLSLLLSRGLGYRFVEQKILGYYTGEQRERIKQILKEKPNDTLRSHPLVHKLHKMVEWDQNVRKYYTALNDGAYMTDSTYAVDSINAMELMRIFSKSGVPNEVVLGNSKWQGYEVTASPDYSIIIGHHNGGAVGGRPSHLLDTFLYKAVINLDYEAHSFAYLISQGPGLSDFKYHDVYLKFPLVINGAYFNGRIYPEYYDAASEKVMNEYRAKIGLESLDDYRRKLEVFNSTLNQNTSLKRYFFVKNILVQDMETEGKLRQWISEYGKNGIKKKSISSQTVIKPNQFYIAFGNIGNRYVVGKTTFGTYKEQVKKSVTSEFFHDHLYYAVWKDRKPPLPQFYHAEVLPNPEENLQTDSGRSNRAKFIPGFKMFVEDGFSFETVADFKKIELGFYNDTLFSFSAFVTPDFYRAINRKVALPTDTILKRDTLFCNDLETVLATTTYVWKKGFLKMEFTSTEALNPECKKKTSAIFSMTDEKKQQLYRKQVAAEKLRLEKMYGKK